MGEEEIRERVRKLMHDNMISGYSKSAGSEFHFTQPSPGRYPYQFFWDTCLHIFILSALEEHDMAKRHLQSLFALQEEDGFVGHMIYWNNVLPKRITDIFQSKPSLKRKLFRSHMSALIQPPLAAQAALRIYKSCGDREFLQQMLPKLKKYYHWIARNRDFHGDGLISIISNFESGMDWKPTFDVVVGFPEKQADWRLFCRVVAVDIRNFWHNYNFRKIGEKDYFLVKDAGFNTIYAQNLQAMAKICEELEDRDAKQFTKLAAQVIQSMLDILYDKRSAAFLDVYGKHNRKVNVLTPTIFFPLVIKEMPDEICKRVIDKHFFHQNEFGAPFPIPSVAKNHPSFNPDQSTYIWRGPTWILLNWFMHQFFLEKGYTKEAQHLVKSIKKLVGKSGFREYYHPFNGEGNGAHDFTWAGLVVDMINMEKEATYKQRSGT
ncbi:glycogen debranching enzyme [Catalinimonas alkaloidigena]|uniref:amylo-alpha-1,6-glucosidase n=1 Tax=Catalinimonas alkaloidigena TaxID=1075417 RepID=UPI0024052CEE|nr:trehalase family glycosidase [Catalinimonas alkaloidigena]MDF9798397.1 glycogen debranching enzyme [Catalinimonas alkaloidigena]